MLLLIFLLGDIDVSRDLPDLFNEKLRFDRAGERECITEYDAPLPVTLLVVVMLVFTFCGL